VRQNVPPPLHSAAKRVEWEGKEVTYVRLRKEEMRAVRGT